jgi:hypothetical protein
VYFAGENVDPAHKKYAGLFQQVTAQKLVKAENEFDPFAKIEKQSKKEASVRPMYFNFSMGIAASIMLITIGFLAGMLYFKTNNEVAGNEIQNIKSDLEHMKRMAIKNQMQMVSASERIKAVSEASVLDSADLEIISILINTMNFDNNVNVRMAAAEALFNFRTQPEVKQALVNSLKIQEDPNMQILLIDMLVVMKEKNAAAEMQRLLNDKKDLNKVVKERAEYGLGVLM